MDDLLNEINLNSSTTYIKDHKQLNKLSMTTIKANKYTIILVLQIFTFFSYLDLIIKQL